VNKSDFPRRLLPTGSSDCRVLCYEYDPDALLAPGLLSDNALLRQASTFIDDLVLERRAESDFRRALIFVCHGFGGLIVKRALIISHSAKESTPWLRSVYLSTYAVLFAGTPHHGISRQALRILVESSGLHANQFVVDLLSDRNASGNLQSSPLLEDLRSQFEPLMVDICVYNFWERQPTRHGSVSALIVDWDSAAPDSERDQRCGINANHKDLLCLNDSSVGGHRKMLETLEMSIRESGPIIEKRWLADTVVPRTPSPHPFGQTRGHEFQRNSISGGRAHFGDNYNFYSTSSIGHSRGQSLSDIYMHKVWKVPRSSSMRFTGRQLQLAMLREQFGEPGQPAGVADPNTPRVVIVYGLGGSGKTQFCIKYAEQNRQR
jgi:hypothetical protein